MSEVISGAMLRLRGAGVVLMLFGATISSAASHLVGNVSQVELQNTNHVGGQLSVQLDGVDQSYYGQQPTPSTSCVNTQTNQLLVPPATAETLRNWQALLSTALVSGRKIRLDYEMCGGYRYITGMVLLR